MNISAFNLFKSCPVCDSSRLLVCGGGVGRLCMECGRAFNVGIMHRAPLAASLIDPETRPVVFIEAGSLIPNCAACDCDAFAITDHIRACWKDGSLFTARCIECLEGVQVCVT